MKNTWHRVNENILGHSHKQGTVSVFFDYNLAHWTFGVRVDPDKLWCSVYFEFGPLALDVTYWRIT